MFALVSNPTWVEDLVRTTQQLSNPTWTQDLVRTLQQFDVVEVEAASST